MKTALHDRIGQQYTSARRPDPRIAAIPHDCSDGFLAAYWRRPEAYLRADLESGEWECRFGHLKALDAFDVCYRLVVSH